MGGLGVRREVEKSSLVKARTPAESTGSHDYAIRPDGHHRVQFQDKQFFGLFHECHCIIPTFTWC